MKQVTNQTADIVIVAFVATLILVVFYQILFIEHTHFSDPIRMMEKASKVKNSDVIIIQHLEDLKGEKCSN